MSTTTLTTYRSRVLERLGLSSTDGMFPSATLTSLVNAGARKVSAVRDWPWLVAQETLTSVAGQAEYTPISAFYRATLRVEDAHGLNIPQKRPRSMTRWLQHTSDRPFFFTTERGKVILAPTPATAGLTFTHTFLRNEPVLSADSDTLLIDALAEDLVVLAAAKMASVRIKDTALSNMIAQEYDELLSAVSDEVNRARGPITAEWRSDWEEF